MLEIKLGKHARWFFDSAEVTRRLTVAQRKILSRFGAYVRQTAQQSIKRAPSRRRLKGRQRKRERTLSNNSSAPGRPPFSHTGLLKRHIYFVFDPQRKSVVIGPARLNKPTAGALAALEYGGTVVLVGKRGSKQVQIAPRPYMQPAFDRELKQLPPRWRDSL